MNNLTPISSIQLPEIVHPAHPPLPSYSFDPAILTNYSYDKYLYELDKLENMEGNIFQAPFYRNFKWEVEELYKKENLLQFLLFLNHSDPFLKYYFLSFETMGEGINCSKMLGLAECACRARSKIKNIDQKFLARRCQDEEKLFRRNFSNFNKNRPFIFTAIGPGGCLQEWVIISQLIFLGFTRFHIYLCEPEKERGIINFTEFFEKFPDVTCEVFCYASMEHFAAMRIASDLVVAMDWNINPKKGKPSANPKPTLLLTERGASFAGKFEPLWDIKKVVLPKQEPKDPFLLLNKV